MAGTIQTKKELVEELKNQEAVMKNVVRAHQKYTQAFWYAVILTGFVMFWVGAFIHYCFWCV